MRKEVCYASSKDQELRGLMRRKANMFEVLPDDLLISIFAKISSSTADSPLDLMNLLTVCKRFKRLVLVPSVLSVASENCLRIRAHKWCESAHLFLRRCVDAENLEACYILGMIKFYALGKQPTGIVLMTRSAMRGHAASLYSLAVIQFNGSGGSKHGPDLRAGVYLCKRAAVCRSIDALRELGFCLEDGYGTEKCITWGRRLHLLANWQEMVTQKHVHVANQFLCEWFAIRMHKLDEKGLGLCSHEQCGRPETRIHEFRRCSICMKANYCSRSCQFQHWTKGHRSNCMPLIEDPLLDVPQ